MIKLRPWKGTKNEFEADIIVTGPSGRVLRKRVKAPVAGKSNAERWARVLEQEMLMQLLVPEPAPAPEPTREPEKPRVPTFEEFAVTFLDLCKANRLGINTRLGYEVNLRLHLNPLIGRRRMNAVTPADLTAIKSSLVHKAHNTMCEVLKTLRRVLNVAVGQGIITQAPVKVEMPRRIRKAVIAYDADEQAALLNAASSLGSRYTVMLLLGLDAGLRRGEMLGLHWTDLDSKRGTMIVRHNIVRGMLDLTKGRSEDEISMTARLSAALQAGRHDRGRFVLANGRGNHFHETELVDWMRELVTLAKVPWHGTHVLRKTCGTRIADGGGGVAAVAAHLRHKDLQTASRYIDRRGASSRALSALES
ncbi:tyrosine-type recombinase/integrase [Nannocystis sp.]|uniref:tyrosine-type recombinase/integrase n=1 Tax=Nannocystis sp. TaxID=1962667 RepID=UPI0025D8EF69|nr:tyrosine-type recombinase/integrase [Nannocystis sp.]MBK7828622.1 tyrosine-type recombinase/integrase [Nannocystis sp.]